MSGKMWTSSKAVSPEKTSRAQLPYLKTPKDYRPKRTNASLWEAVCTMEAHRHPGVLY